MLHPGPLFGDWPFTGLSPASYGMIMADPPWDFSNWSEKGEVKNAKAHYRCMPMEWIMSLPVLDLAAPDSLLWCWGTPPMLDQQIVCVKSWGFTYVTQGTWVKTTKNGKLHFGTGYFMRGAGEPFLLFKRGKPKIAARDIRNVFLAPVGKHSEKPAKSYQMCERMAPKVLRLELLSRTNRKGWDAWGDEIGKLGEAA